LGAFQCCSVRPSFQTVGMGFHICHGSGTTSSDHGRVAIVAVLELDGTKSCSA
jgi:hypothetical protein